MVDIFLIKSECFYGLNKKKIKKIRNLIGIFDGVNPIVFPINNVIIKFSDKMFCLKKKSSNPASYFLVTIYQKIRYQQLHFIILYKLKQWLLLLSSIFYKFKDLIWYFFFYIFFQVSVKWEKNMLNMAKGKEWWKKNIINDLFSDWIKEIL